MSRIATIEVEYRKRVAPAPYELEEAAVKLVTVFDTEGENSDAGVAAEAALALAKARVRESLGLQPPPARVAIEESKPKAVRVKAEKRDSSADVTRSAEADAHAKANDQTAANFEAAFAEAVQAAPAEATVVAKGDLPKAIRAAQERMQHTGVVNGNKLIMDLVASYMPEAAPMPIAYSRIAEARWGEFVVALSKLGR